MSSADFFKFVLFKNSFRNTIRVSKSLDPDQEWHSVVPVLGPNCLQRLSADKKSSPARKVLSKSCVIHTFSYTHVNI